MMQVNEIRIGNLTKQGEIVQIRENSARVEYLFEGILKQSYVNYINLDAIDLTEEILLKCPKISKQNGYPYKLFNGYLKLRNGVFFFKYYDLEIDLPYLHQLQNLYFALTGNELEVNL